MQISTFALYGIVEAIVFLLLICFFLLIYIRRSKTKLTGMQNNLQKMLVKHKQLKQKILQEREEHSTSNTYKKQINDQLLLTRAYHKSLDAGQDIALDLNPESPLDRQTAAIRHAMLVAEKEALNSSTDGTPSWEFLQTKFQQFIQFYVDLSGKKSTPAPVAPTPSESAVEESNEDDGNEELVKQLNEAKSSLAEKIAEMEVIEKDLETAHKRIGNLEKFKKLFFDMEKKWEEAKAEAEMYYQRLQGLRDQVDDSDEYDNLINDYHNVYSEFELTLQDFSEEGTEDEQQVGDLDQTSNASEALPEFSVEATPDPESIGSTNDLDFHAEAVEIMNSEKQALEELKKLRNLTADQHRLIAKLQKQLEEAETIEQKEALIGELQTELKRQVGFVQESEACIQLLENELSNAMGRLKALEDSLTNAESELQHVPNMQTTIRQFAHESKAMLMNLTELEKMNEQLQASQTQSDNSENEELIQKMQEQLQTLQGQYAELEERYLEAKMSD